MCHSARSEERYAALRPSEGHRSVPKTSNHRWSPPTEVKLTVHLPEKRAPLHGREHHCETCHREQPFDHLIQSNPGAVFVRGRSLQSFRGQVKVFEEAYVQAQMLQFSSCQSLNVMPSNAGAYSTMHRACDPACFFSVPVWYRHIQSSPTPNLN